MGSNPDLSIPVFVQKSANKSDEFCFCGISFLCAKFTVIDVQWTGLFVGKWSSVTFVVQLQFKRFLDVNDKDLHDATRDTREKQ